MDLPEEGGYLGHEESWVVNVFTVQRFNGQLDPLVQSMFLGLLLEDPVIPCSISWK